MTGRDQSAPPRRRGWKSTAARLAFAFCAALLMLEAAFQLILPGFEYLDLAQWDDHLFVRFIPHREKVFHLRRPSILNSGAVLRSYPVRINSLGLRADRDYPIPKPAGVYRVLCLGDSITFGWGIPLDEGWPRLLERELSRRLAGRRVEVINAGYPGYSSRQGLIWLDRELLRLAPDAVVVEFGFNDSLPGWFRTRGPIRMVNDQQLMAGGPGHWQPIPRGPLMPLNCLVSRAYTVQFALMIWSKLHGQNPIYAAGGGREDGRGRLYEWARVPPADYRGNLVAMAGLCTKAGARPILVHAWGTPEAYRAEVRAAGETTGATVIYQSELILSALGRPREIAADPRFAAQVAALQKEPHPFPPGIFSLLLVDYIHPNLISNTLFAEKLADTLAPAP